MLDRRSFLGATGAALIVGPAFAATPITVSAAGLIFLSISVNGREARALVDTGSVRGIQLSQAFAGQAALALSDSGQTTQRYPAGSFDLGAAASAGVALPLERGPALPVIAGRLSGQPLTFLIDTGAPWCNLDQSLAPGAAANSRVELGFEIGGHAFTATFRIRDLGAMSRGLGARAVIGHRFLRDFRLAWVPDAGAMRLGGVAG